MEGPAQFGIVTDGQVSHGVARNRQGDPLEGIVIMVTGVDSLDGEPVGATLFLLPQMARGLTELILESLETLGHEHPGPEPGS